MQYCEKRKSNLAEYESKKQQDDVTAILVEQKYWIGLTDKGVEGKISYFASNNPFTCGLDFVK